MLTKLEAESWSAIFVLKDAKKCNIMSFYTLVTKTYSMIYEFVIFLGSQKVIGSIPILSTGIRIFSIF